MTSRTGIQTFLKEFRRQREVRCQNLWWAISHAAFYAHSSVRVLSPGLHWMDLTPKFWDEVNLFADRVAYFEGRSISRWERRHPKDRPSGVPKPVPLFTQYLYAARAVLQYWNWLKRERPIRQRPRNTTPGLVTFAYAVPEKRMVNGKWVSVEIAP